MVYGISVFKAVPLFCKKKSVKTVTYFSDGLVHEMGAGSLFALTGTLACPQDYHKRIRAVFAEYHSGALREDGLNHLLIFFIVHCLVNYKCRDLESGDGVTGDCLIIRCKSLGLMLFKVISYET